MAENEMTAAKIYDLNASVKASRPKIQVRDFLVSITDLRVGERNKVILQLVAKQAELEEAIIAAGKKDSPPMEFDFDDLREVIGQALSLALCPDPDASEEDQAKQAAFLEEFPATITELEWEILQQMVEEARGSPKELVEGKA